MSPTKLLGRCLGCHICPSVIKLQSKYFPKKNLTAARVDPIVKIRSSVVAKAKLPGPVSGQGCLSVRLEVSDSQNNYGDFCWRFFIPRSWSFFSGSCTEFLGPEL